MLEMVCDSQCNHYLGLGHHSVDPRSDPRPRGVPRVILGVVYVILMTELVLECDSYEKSYWKWHRRPLTWFGTLL